MIPLTIVKIGGQVIDETINLHRFLHSFAQIPGLKVLVHGGGKLASAMSRQLGITPILLDGRRVTDDESIDIVTMVYGGLVNKQIVARLQHENQKAIGLTGADMNLIAAHKRPVINGLDYGWVGDIDQVNQEVLEMFLSANVIPVIAPLTHDGKGNMLNTNADTMASTIATALTEQYQVRLIYSFEKNGVLLDAEDESTLMLRLDHERFEALKAEQKIFAGMIPKLKNAFDARAAGVAEVYICHSDKILPVVQGEEKQFTTID